MQDNDLRVSIVRGAIYAQHQPRKVDPNGEYIWQDQGIQTFRMVLAPHAGTWQDAGVVHMAEELTAPVPVLYQGIHKGTRAQSASFLSVDVPNVVVSDVKQAEDGNDLIIRCYETAGRATKASLDLGLVHRHWTGRVPPARDQDASGAADSGRKDSRGQCPRTVKWLKGKCPTIRTKAWKQRVKG